MVYELLADGVVLVHFLWILFLIFGALWGVRHKWVKALHVGGLFFAFVINVFGLYCPLTDLETWLRTKGSPSGAYGGSFISHYLEKLIYLDVPEYVIALMSAILCAFNAWVYLRRRPASS